MINLTPTNPLAAVIVMLSAYGCVFVLSKNINSPAAEHRFRTIDGLRGYLALFVFIHHACIWFYYLKVGVWDAPPSRIYSHFGQSSVLLFFMVTGLLFYSKVLSARGNGIDWAKLYVGRFLRLTPLYALAVSVLFLLVMQLTGWTVRESSVKFIAHLVSWLLFTIPSSPNINGLKDTYLLMAGVTWSLRYEWAFYFYLPFLSVVTAAGTNIVVRLCLSLIVPLLCYLFPAIVNPVLAFLGGVVSAFLVRSEGFREFCRTRVASLIACCLAVAAVTVFGDSDTLITLVFLSAIFALISGGCSLFGVLDTEPSRLLGEMTYSIYLLHGLLLFAVFRFVIGFEHGGKLSPLMHWAVIVAIVPVLLGVSFVAHTFVENPPLSLVEQWALTVRKFVGIDPKTADGTRLPR